MMITPYLAMTAAEIQKADPLPEKIAYMACHFSPYSTGISNIPHSLPRGSMLILNDITPIYKHDPKAVAEQIQECIQRFSCNSLLLDFQRNVSDDMISIAKAILEAAECPTAVTSNVTDILSCPVFLPPCPAVQPLTEYIAPWKDREIWLELSMKPTKLRITQKGTFPEEEYIDKLSGIIHRDTALHCHYTLEVQGKNAIFTFQRNQEDIRDLLDEANKLGIQKAIGLYQQMWL